MTQQNVQLAWNLGSSVGKGAKHICMQIHSTRRRKTRKKTNFCDVSSGKITKTNFGRLRRLILQQRRSLVFFLKF